MYKMEIRNTQYWEDCRYRSFTTSKKKADEFMRLVKRISFTDSGHGLVPTVSECKSRKDGEVRILATHVRECLASQPK